jgi:hypothetical protein
MSIRITTEVHPDEVTVTGAQGSDTITVVIGKNRPGDPHASYLALEFHNRHDLMVVHAAISAHLDLGATS